jgi:alpha-galactosidase
MDWNEARAKITKNNLTANIEGLSPPLKDITLETSTNLRNAITDAKYVISTFINGGIDAYKMDMEIPLKYGIDQTIGDTMGPAGIFRFLRNAKIYRDIMREMNEVGYNAGHKGLRSLHFNYTNPISLGTWFCNLLWENSTIGICHGVQSTAQLLREILEVPVEDFSFISAGITHMSWFLKIFCRKSNINKGNWMDAYPIIQEKVNSPNELLQSEKIRCDIFNATGYFPTESSGSISELLPYYRKRKSVIKRFQGAEQGYDSLLHAEDLKNFIEFEQMADKNVEENERVHKLFKRSHETEYISRVIHAIEQDEPMKFYGSVLNKGAGLITNLPTDCCVEVPCMADSFGIHPQGGIELPIICQGLCTAVIMSQKAVIQYCITGEEKYLYHALLLDPLTASVATPDKIKEMMDEMLKKESQWLEL